MRLNTDSLDTAIPMHSYGIDSLDAADVSRRVRDTFGVTVGMAGFLGDLSLDEVVSDIINRRNEAAITQHQPPVHTPPGGLSHGQLALWTIHQNRPLSSAYNLAYALKSVGALDPVAMGSAFTRLVARHDALRTTFPTTGGHPSTHTASSVIPDFQYISGINGNDLAAALNVESAEPFDLGTGPLVRLRLFNVNGQFSVLLLLVHHIVTDFWSITVLLRDLLEMYAAISNARPDELPPVEAGYRDFIDLRSQQLASPIADADLAYWRRALSGVLSPLELTTDRPRPKQPTQNGGAYAFEISPQTTTDLRDLARQSGSTLFMTVLSGFFALLHRYTGQDDIIVGVPTSGRDRREWLNVVGYFVNPVPLRARFSDDMSCRTLLANTRKTVLGAMNHQNYPFALIVEELRPKRDPSRSPIFQSMFVWQSQASGIPEVPGALALGLEGVTFNLSGISLETMSAGGQSAQFDLTLSIAEQNDGLSAALKYSADLFDRDTAVGFADRFEAVLHEMSASPEVLVSLLTL
jgi:hypothetical protein